MGGTENCSQSWDTLKELLAGEESCGSAFLLALSVLTPFAALISLGGEEEEDKIQFLYIIWIIGKQKLCLIFYSPKKKLSEASWFHW